MTSPLMATMRLEIPAHFFRPPMAREREFKTPACAGRAAPKTPSASQVHCVAPNYAPTARIVAYFRVRLGLGHIVASHDRCRPNSLRESVPLFLRFEHATEP